MAADPDALARAFEAHRPHLTTVARRLLGSTSEADDAVQEAWLRLARTGDDGIENLGGWLTTTVARLSLSMLRARRTRREEPADDGPVLVVPDDGPEETAVTGDAVGLALLLVLERLSPVERLAFVLHDLFGLPYDEIAPIVERTPAAARQLASRARRRVRDGEAAESLDPADRGGRREVVTAFLAAAREGDFAGLLRVLDPEVVLRADDTAVAQADAGRAYGAPELVPEVGGADAVARIFCGRASAAAPVLLDGAVHAVYASGGQVRSVFRLTLAGDRIVGVEVVADRDRIADLDLVLLDR